MTRRRTTPNSRSREQSTQPIRKEMKKSDFIYTSCYCEENSWHLAKRLTERKTENPLIDKERPQNSSGNETVSSDEASFSSDENEWENVHVLFVSNEQNTVPFWFQQNQLEDPETIPVVWDYHVFVIAFNKRHQKNFVLDLDTILPFPCDFETYSKLALRPFFMKQVEDRYQRMYRVVPAHLFLKYFASDRSHMLKEDGSWKSPPPTYCPIFTETCTNNLQQYLNMMGKCSNETGNEQSENANITKESIAESNCYGEVITEDEFIACFM